MGGIVPALLWGVLALIPLPEREQEADRHDRLIIVTFDPLLDPDVKARELCLLHGCTLHHVYRTIAGMAASGGNLAALTRASGITGVEVDLSVGIQENTAILIGAPGHAPLAVLGGGLDATRLVVERTWQYSQGGLQAREDLWRTTGLIENLARRQPQRVFWSFDLLGPQGKGRLSDLLAALDQIAGLRYAIGAVFIPLQVEGRPPPILCEMIDKVLRKGLLVITDVDAACSQP